MQSTTNEQALEAAIEKALTGTCLEELNLAGTGTNTVNERAAIYRSGNGF